VPHWAVAPTGHFIRRGAGGQLTYKDRDRTADGVGSVKLKPGLPGKAKAQLAAGGADMLAPALGGIAAPVVVQLVDHDSAVCFESVFEPEDVRQNDADVLKAKRAL
jgi:hypothetical protein